MAKTVFLNFALKKLKAAEDAAKRILVSVKKSATLSKEERKEQAKDARQNLREIRGRRRFEQKRLRLEQRAGRIGERDLLARDRAGFAGFFGTAGAAREKGELFANALGGGQGVVSALPQLISGVGQFIPGMGPFTALIGPLFEKLLSHMEERLEQELQKRETEFLAKLEESRFRSDFARRLKEDPEFQEQQVKLALQETIRQEALLGKRSDRSLSLLEDFGL